MENVGTRHVKQNALGTGVPALDRLLDGAPPQVLAAGLAIGTMAFLDPDIGAAVLRNLEERLAPIIDRLGSAPDDDSPDAVLAPRWLAFRAGIMAGCR